MFKKNGGKTIDVDIDLLEKRLKKAKREVFKSLLNHRYSVSDLNGTKETLIKNI